MFLDSGDGVVFKENIGPWYAPKTGEFHLSASAARTLLEQSLESYRSKHDWWNTKEVFIHGKVCYSDEEWRGFLDATLCETNLMTLKIAAVDEVLISVPVISNTPLAFKHHI